MKKYIILIIIIAIEFHILFMLNLLNVKLETWIGNVIGGFAGFFPIQMVLYLLSREPRVPEWIKKCCKGLFWFINICYILSCVFSYGM